MLLMRMRKFVSWQMGQQREALDDRALHVGKAVDAVVDVDVDVAVEVDVDVIVGVGVAAKVVVDANVAIDWGLSMNVNIALHVFTHKPKLNSLKMQLIS